METDMNMGSAIYQLVAFLIPVVILLVIVYALKQRRSRSINEREVADQLQGMNEKLDQLLMDKERTNK